MFLNPLVALLVLHQGNSISLQRNGAKRPKPTHHFTHNRSIISLSGRKSLGDAKYKDCVRLLHVTDTHACIRDDVPPYSTRMCNAYAHSHDWETGRPQQPRQSFEQTLDWGCDPAHEVDVLLLGGDLVNFPSPSGVEWATKLLKDKCLGMKMVYTNGNHDWMIEGKAKEGPQYDWQREGNSESVLGQFHDLMDAHRESHGERHKYLFGSTKIHKAGGVVRVVWVDNSNYQILPEQLDFFKKVMDDDEDNIPVVLMAHIPFYLGAGDTRGPSDTCGHPDWGTAADGVAYWEERPKWPTRNLPSTMEFIKLLEEKAAPNGHLVAVLSGHTHQDKTVEVEKDTEEKTLATQPMVCQRSLGAFSCNREGLGEEVCMEYTTGANFDNMRRVVDVCF